MSTLLEVAFAAVRQIGEGFTTPEDDWAPVLLYPTRNGDYGIAGMSMPDVGQRDLLAEKITSLLIKHHCDEAVFIASCWGIEAESRDLLAAKAQEVPDLSTHPKRMECLQVCHVDREHAATYMAKITRPNGIAVLGEFEDPIENSDVSGRFVDCIRAGIK